MSCIVRGAAVGGRFLHSFRCSMCLAYGYLHLRGGRVSTDRHLPFLEQQENRALRSNGRAQ
jgi:hypothetical protein